MKYIFLKNTIKINTNLMKFFLMQVLFTIIYLCINGSTIAFLEVDDYICYLGLGSIYRVNIFYTLIKIISYLIIIYFIIKTFVDNIKSSIEYIMLRSNSKKFVLLEWLNFIFYIFSMRTIINIIVVILFIVFNSNISYINYLYIYLKDILFFTNLSLIMTLILNLLSLERLKKYLTIFLVLLIVTTIFINLYNIPICIYLISLLILIIINLITFIPSRFYSKYCTK